MEKEFLYVVKTDNEELHDEFDFGIDKLFQTEKQVLDRANELNMKYSNLSHPFFTVPVEIN